MKGPDNMHEEAELTPEVTETSSPEQEFEDIILAEYRGQKAKEAADTEILREFIKSILRGTAKTELEEHEEEHESVIEQLASNLEIKKAFENYRDKKPEAVNFNFGVLIRSKLELLKQESPNL